MTQDTYSPTIVRGALRAPSAGVDLKELSELPHPRCAEAARMRGEPLHASAVRYQRFLLLETPGPWGSSALDAKRMGSGVAEQLAEAAAAANAHVVLIRRPGRHASASSSASSDRQPAMAWAFADTSPGAERVVWGAWRDPHDLLSLDLTAPVPGSANAAGPQRLALVCTNGKRDQCCALQGRPVAAAVAADTRWDTWECSHLGGHRFAATIMLLPTGDMFGWLDPKSALEVVRRFDAGQLVLSHYRGQAGRPLPVQAALHAAAVRLGDFRRRALTVSSVRPTDQADCWEVEIIHHTEHSPGIAYRVVIAGSWLAPTLLSCADRDPKAEVHYEPLSFSRID